MGFLVMIISALLGIFLVALGVSGRKNKRWYTVFIVLGIVFILCTIYLACPH